MAITGQFFNHTLDDFASGSNIPGDTYKLVLVSASYTYDATDTNYTDLSANEIYGGGWTQGGYTLASVVTVPDVPSRRWSPPPAGSRAAKAAKASDTFLRIRA